MILRVEIEHQIGDKVFHKTDPEQKELIVTAIKINPGNMIQYEVVSGLANGMLCFGMELCKDRNVILATQN